MTQEARSGSKAHQRGALRSLMKIKFKSAIHCCCRAKQLWFETLSLLDAPTIAPAHCRIVSRILVCAFFLVSRLEPYYTTTHAKRQYPTLRKQHDRRRHASVHSLWFWGGGGCTATLGLVALEFQTKTTTGERIVVVSRNNTTIALVSKIPRLTDSEARIMCNPLRLYAAKSTNPLTQTEHQQQYRNSNNNQEQENSNCSEILVYKIIAVMHLPCISIRMHLLLCSPSLLAIRITELREQIIPPVGFPMPLPTYILDGVICGGVLGCVSRRREKAMPTVKLCERQAAQNFYLRAQFFVSCLMLTFGWMNFAKWMLFTRET